MAGYLLVPLLDGVDVGPVIPLDVPPGQLAYAMSQPGLLGANITHQLRVDGQQFLVDSLGA